MKVFRPVPCVLSIALLGLLATSALTCGGSDKGPEPYACAGTREECINALAGRYQGTYSGDGSGSWSVEISTAGALTGSADNARTGGTFDLLGSADESGRMVFGTASDGAEFRGTVAVDFSVAGTWDIGGDKGTFNKDDFAFTTSCDAGLAGGAISACQVTVTYNPKTAPASKSTATLEVAESGAGGSVASANLSGMVSSNL